MKFKELQHKTKDELQTMLNEARVKLGQFTFQLQGKTLKDVSELSKTKKAIARIMTMLNHEHEK